MTDASAVSPNQPTGTAPAVDHASTPAAQAVLNKLKVDWEDGNSEEFQPEDLVSHYKLTKKEAAQLRNQMDPVMQFLSALQGGELDSLYNLNIPEDRMLDFAEKVLTKKLQWENMSPEQKSMIQKEKELAERERQFKEWEAKQEAARKQEMDNRALEQVQRDIVDAIGELGLQGKPTPRLIRRIAEQLKAQIESEKPMDARKASRYEWDNIQKELNEFQLFAVQNDPVKFVESLPKEVRKAIRDYEVKAGSPFQKAKNDDEPSERGGNVRDFDYLDKLYGSKPKRRMK